MTVRPVEISMDDETVLRGQLWLESSDWVSLLHDVGDDQDLDCWRPLVPYLLGQQVSVLAIDLRGHGASDGTWRADLAVEDVVAMFRFARKQGAESVIAVAAGATAATVLEAAANESFEGMVLLSPSVSAEGRADSGQSLPRGAGVPKLLIAGSASPNHLDMTDRLRSISIGWALAVKLPTAEQGTALLNGEWSTHVREHILGFLRERRALASASPRAAAHPPEAFLESLGIKPKGIEQ